jgi:predicted RNA-binding protein YlxR (DUF448 family)
MQAQPHEEGLDAGPRHAGPGAERFCAVTGTVKPVADMIRFVLAPDGAAVPDLKRRLPGRGIWITATREALTSAVARKAFSRSFKRDVRLPRDFVATTEGLLERSALDALAIARKAGKVAIGYAKVEAALTEAKAVVLLHAAEAAADGVRKLKPTGRARPDGTADSIPVVGVFTSAQLDLALGRSNVIHAALKAGPESETFLARARRLERFRTGVPAIGDSPGGPC